MDQNEPPKVIHLSQVDDIAIWNNHIGCLIDLCLKSEAHCDIFICASKWGAILRHIFSKNHHYFVGRHLDFFGLCDTVVHEEFCWLSHKVWHTVWRYIWDPILVVMRIDWMIFMRPTYLGLFRAKFWVNRIILKISFFNDVIDCYCPTLMMVMMGIDWMIFLWSAYHGLCSWKIWSQSGQFEILDFFWFF